MDILGSHQDLIEPITKIYRGKDGGPSHPIYDHILARNRRLSRNRRGV